MIAVTIEQLEENFGRTLTEDERNAAKPKLKRAVIMIYRRRRDIEEAIEDDVILRESFIDIVCEMVKRAIKRPDDQPDNLNNLSQTAGPYTIQQGFRDTGGALYLTRSERRELGIFRKGSMTDITGRESDD